MNNPPFRVASERRKRRNLAVLAATSFLRGAHVSIYGVIWQPFVLSLGASMPTLGLLNSLGGPNGIATTLVQPLGGWLADRSGRKPFLVAASLATIAGYTLYAISGWLDLWLLLLLGVIFLGVSALYRPALSSMIAESVRAERHGSAFSLITVAQMLPGILAPTLGGWFADRSGYESVFLVILGFEALALILLWRYLSETRVSIVQGMDGRDAVRAVMRSFIPPKGMGGFFVACAGDAIVWGLGWSLIYGMATETLHLTAGQLGILSTVTSLTWAVAQMPIGRYLDKHETKGVMILSEALGIPLMLIWLVESRFEILAASQVFYALTAATWIPTISVYAARRIGEAERAEVFGRLNAFRGLLSFPAPLIGGLLFNLGGMALPLSVNLVGIFVVMAILWLFVDEPTSALVPDAENRQIAETRSAD